MDPEQLAAVKQAAREGWSTGDYPQIGARLVEASERVAEALAPTPGMRVLDVGTGSGNTAVAVARRGADVVSIDHVQAWFPAARAAAKAAGVQVELRQADAEDLPFGDGSFDAVVSTFAHIFAPRHDVVAGEMARVLRPGGRLVVATWADGDLDDAFSVLTRHAPESLEGVGNPDDWGSAAYVRSRFGPAGVDITDVAEHVLVWRFDTRDEVYDLLFTASGPLIALRDALAAEGRWEGVRQEFFDALDAHNRLDDGTYGRDMPYLLAVGQRRAD